MSEKVVKFLDYAGLSKYTEQVKTYVDSKSAFIYNFDVEPNLLADGASMPKSYYDKFVAAYDAGRTCVFILNGVPTRLVKYTGEPNTYLGFAGAALPTPGLEGNTIEYNVFIFEGVENETVDVTYYESYTIIPTKTSDLINDSGFVTVEDPDDDMGGEVEGIGSEYLVKGPQVLTSEEQAQVKENLGIVMPTKLSQLENDIIQSIPETTINNTFADLFSK